ncbi:SGNH/GDSL hydrolase family protein [Microlunatus kandeliicorticis]|uniref:SGNH/GDSL hydrolase family protein n=1 Tax=Microlunatus kandeliicorticis TaxID=1759536 RepID=UPI0015FA5DC7|nr:SGNH/GDSL hydrolase family protein [Microlunatus kandeliicorticis]
MVIPSLVLVLLVGVVGVAIARRLHQSVDWSGAGSRPTVVETPTERASPSPTATDRSPRRTVAPSSDPTPSASPSPADYHQVLGLGDSVTAGTNCGCTDFVTQLAGMLADQQDTDVSAVNRGVNGATAADLLSDLKNDDDLRSTVAQSDVIVVTIGANDLSPSLDTYQQNGSCSSSCYQSGIDQMGSDLDDLLGVIRQLRHGKATALLVTNYWNVFEDGSVGAKDDGGQDYLDWSDAITRAANTAICDAAASNSATCVDLYGPFKGDGSQDPTDLLADDGDHPNAAGTKLIAQVLDAQLERPTPHATTQ